VTLHKGCGHSIQGTDGPKVQDLGSEMVAGQRSKVKGQGSKVKGQRSQVKGQGSKVKGRRSKVKGQRSKVKGQRSKVKEDGLTSLDRRFKSADAADALG